MKTDKQTQWESFTGEVERRDYTITLFMGLYSDGCKAIDALIDRIGQGCLSDLKISDFNPSIEILSRSVFVEMVDGFEDVYIASSDKFRLSMYPEIRSKYERKLCKLTKAIEDGAPNSQQAKQLAAVIDRLAFEVTDALSRGTEQYLHGKGKPQPADLLSDERHGALWDRVENAIIALSTEQAETSGEISAKVCAEVRAEFRGLKKKSNAKEIRWMQLEAAAKWLKAERAAGKKASLVDAANYVDVENNKGGYTTTAALLTALYEHAAELGIAQFIASRNKYKPRKR